MRHHCAQCLTEVFATGRQAPTGETLCAPCYSALWGPKATDALRQMVQRHSSLPARNGRVATQRA
jgi:recombinational DNA repair protein (RecF pathway)